MKKEKNKNQKIESPCVRNCCLDEQDICLGCFRSLAEIRQWTEVNNRTRQQFLYNADERKIKSKR